MISESFPFVSVIVPTYQDWERLKICLEALSNQTYPSEKFEVILVNNDFQEEPPYKIKQENVIIITEKNLGSYSARNSGLKIAHGKIIAFTDSDCIPYPDWIEKAVIEILNGADRVAGRIELFYQSINNLTIAEIYEKAFAFNQSKNALKGVSVTANMIVTAATFDRVGLFNERLSSGGDIEWSLRACNLNIPIIYTSSAVVRHPARHTFFQLLRKRKRIAKGLVEFQKFNNCKDFSFYIFRGFMPPLSVLSDLAKRNDLKIDEKIYAWLTLYFLKIFSKLEYIKLKLTTN